MENEKMPAAEKPRELRLSTRWLLEGCLSLSEELGDQCERLYQRLDKENSPAVYDALDVRQMADRLSQVLQAVEENEGISEE